MTVSYTCQKPIKFWAKCKINLLYKLNQSLLCVPGCPLLLATRLRTWAPFLLPLIWRCSLEVHSLPGLPSCLISHHVACSSHIPALCYPSVHPTCFTDPQKTSSACCHSCVYCAPLPCRSLWQPVESTYAIPLHLPEVFLNWFQISALSLSYPSVATSYITFCASVSGSIKWR